MQYRNRNSIKRRGGFSLLELLAVVVILGIIAAVVIPRISFSSTVARESVHQQNRAEINSAVERWWVEKGSFPASDLSDIGADPNYFPDGLPVNPIDGSSYTLGPNSRAQ